MRCTPLLLAIGICLVLNASIADAGMPSPLPSGWTSDNQPSWAPSGSSSPALSAARLQAISFFTACLLVSAWAMKGLWHVLRKDFTKLPALTYGRAVSLVALWGLLFVVVLTMISGARELMTPGAWRKQGRTYKLVNSQSVSVAENDRDGRRKAMERLKAALWQYAATHEGRFPVADDPEINADLWRLPGWPGLSFQIAPDRVAENVGRLLVFEPEVEGDERLVVLTNGVIGTMTSAEIRGALEEEPR